MLIRQDGSESDPWRLHSQQVQIVNCQTKVGLPDLLLLVKRPSGAKHPDYEHTQTVCLPQENSQEPPMTHSPRGMGDVKRPDGPVSMLVKKYIGVFDIISAL